MHDTNEQSSFIVATIAKLTDRSRSSSSGFRLPTTLSYWTFSDIMNEVNAETQLGKTSLAPGWTTNASFHGGFGLVNAFGVPKPSFRAYELLHQAYDYQHPVHRRATTTASRRTAAAAAGTTAAATAAADALCNITTGVIATASGNGSIQLLVYNHQEWDAPDIGHPNPSIPCRLTIVIDASSNGSIESSGSATSSLGKQVRHGADARGGQPLRLPSTAQIRVIDGLHANPRQKWIELGMPSYPSPAQHAAIMAASQMVTGAAPLVPVQGSAFKKQLTITAARHSITAVNIELDECTAEGEE